METENKTDSRGLGNLVEHVRRHEALRRIDGLIRSGKKRVDLTGLRGSSPVFVTEALRLLLKRRVVVVCPDAEAAQDACSDLQTISSGRVKLFPEKDIFPQRFELRENLTLRGQRNACLDKLQQDKVDVVVTSLAGFLEKTPPVDFLKTHARTLRVGETIDLDTLIGSLVTVGYDGSPAVDEIGQFAVRGSIVDLFDPSWENPARLELLDDEIESIRSFDIDTQRSIDALESVRVLPATGVIVESATLDALGKNLAVAGFAAATIAKIKHEIAHHRFSYLIRRYAPAMGTTGSLLDYFSEPPLLVFHDEEALGKSFDALGQEVERIRHLTEDDFPILDLEHYIHPRDGYTHYDSACVHIHRLGESPRGAIALKTREHPSVLGKMDAIIELIRKLHKRNVIIHVFSESSAQRERLADMLGEEEELVHLPVGWMTSGFVWEDAGLAVLTDHEIFHRSLPRPYRKRKTRRTRDYRQDQLEIGDFVVHVDYGIGRYLGLEKLVAGGGDTECLILKYQGNDRIFVPLEQMPLVEKYIGKEGLVPALDKLGGSRWQRTKERTRKALEDVARGMITADAQRQISAGHAFCADTQWQKELEASFPFEETPHQLTATEELKQDMEAPTPMERLVCGDVGFGKTEVAIRGAFKAVNDGKQVAVLVPTTILALQHTRTFSERMQAFPVRVEMLSRFRTPAEQKQVVKDLKAGLIDIVIGTHRLLSKDIEFNDLGLIIVDEEHRFGVRSKEKLKNIKKSVDVVSMTATPIPRTLYMALSGLRKISMIDTPPRNRHPVKTEVLPFDEDVIVEAIRYEVDRGGQVFFVHNRVQTIHSIQAFLEKLMPDVKFRVGHGQMREKELEGVILGFLNKEYNVLICTTIIESGLDFPNVNTIIINRADWFGLAELYQLRGRVGRRERQAFAYLLVPRDFTVTHSASKRLLAMEEFEELGSGYRLAMRDLEIRGSGNVLGVEQHGQLVAVGFDLYCKMLKEAVEKLQGQEKVELPPCRIETRLPSLLPPDYVEDQNERMGIYKRLARMEVPADVDDLKAELIDRFGALPDEALNLIELTRIKVWGMNLGVAVIQLKPGRVVVEFLPGKALKPELCARLVETFEGRVLFKSGDTFGLTLTHGGRDERMDSAEKLLGAAWDYANPGTDAKK
ncbi:MAG: transcription-repair coupling factor [bacterium]|nr:transcription-repair coupling factor [bacterium]